MGEDEETWRGGDGGEGVGLRERGASSGIASSSLSWKDVDIALWYMLLAIELAGETGRGGRAAIDCDMNNCVSSSMSEESDCGDDGSSGGGEAVPGSISDGGSTCNCSCARQGAAGLTETGVVGEEASGE